MIPFVAKRLLQAAFAMLAILTLLFALLRLTGDPAFVIAGPGADARVIAALREQLGLDRPIPEQYLTMLSGAVRLDLGDSYLYTKPALAVAVSAIGSSLVLVLVAEAVILLLAFGIGLYAGVTRSVLSRALMISSFVGQSIPFFWLALMFVLVFAIDLRLLPATAALRRDGPVALVLPTLAIAAPGLATLSRLVRGQVIDVMAQPFVLTARSKGLRFPRILFLHVLPNALPPIISWVGIQFSFLLGGLIVLEPIFNYSGIGNMMIQAVEGRDFALVTAGVFLTSPIVLGVNLLADVANRALDPRLRVAQR